MAWGDPIKMQDGYDLSSLINKGQGNVDSDVNIAKLALALEVGAAAGYVSDTMHLKSPDLIELEAGIACVEAIHAARIRAAFNGLGVKVPVVSKPVLIASSREKTGCSRSPRRRSLPLTRSASSRGLEQVGE